MDEQVTREGIKTAPEGLLRGFTAGRFAAWMVVALAIHVVVIGATSMGYVRDRWIDPEGAAERKAALEAVKASAQPAPVPAAPRLPQTTATVAAAKAAVTNDGTLLAARRNTPIVQAITSTPASNTIPRQPDDIGISIGDTNVK
jgi:hypothetical protein